MKESCRGERRRWGRWTAKKPTDRDHDERMDDRGVGMACEKSREGGEEMENICSVYLLRSRMHDHNPPLQSHRLSLPPSIFLSPSLSLFPPLSLSVFSLLFLCPHPLFLLLHISSWWGWHSVSCLDPSASSSGCISLLYITAKDVVFNKNILLHPNRKQKPKSWFV